MNILIVGLGLIGGSYAKAFRKYTDHVIAGIDCDEKTLENAVNSGAIHKIGDRNDIESADLIVVSLYPQAAADFINTNKDNFKDGAIITDSCGVKRAIYDKLDKSIFDDGKVSFIGAHPMAGREQSGFDYSDADMFNGASLIITADNPQSEAAITVRNIAL